MITNKTITYYYCELCSDYATHEVKTDGVLKTRHYCKKHIKDIMLT